MECERFPFGCQTGRTEPPLQGTCSNRPAVRVSPSDELSVVNVRRRFPALVAWAAVFVVGAPTVAGAQHVTVDLMLGSAYNVPTPLTIRQEEQPELRHTAHYDTKPFGPFAPYYAGRVSFWRGDAAWEIAVIHHRLFLSNTTAEISRFEIHYGYSYLLAGRAWRVRGFEIHADGGLVMTNPANVVRGLPMNTGDPEALDAGYDITGVGGSAAVSREFRLVNRLSLVGTAAVVAGTVSVPVAGGSARAPNVGLHGQIGARLRF